MPSSTLMDPAEEALDAAQRLLEAGSLAEALPLLERSGEQLLKDGRDDKAARVLIAAARLRAIADPAGAAALLDRVQPAAARAGCLAELWQARAEAVPAQAETAWQQAAALGGEDLRRAALLHLAALRRAADDPLGAAARYGEALKLPSVRADLDSYAGLLIDRAICLFAGGDEAGAQAELQQAEALIGSGPGHNAQVRARLLGQQAVMATAHRRHDEALRLAGAARATAVEGNDVMSYLAASLLIASIYIEAGREVDAYDALVRARVSLKDLLGPQGEQLVQPAITAFADRLGPRFDEVRDHWIAERRKHRNTSN